MADLAPVFARVCPAALRDPVNLWWQQGTKAWHLAETKSPQPIRWRLTQGRLTNHRDVWPKKQAKPHLNGPDVTHTLGDRAGRDIKNGRSENVFTPEWIVYRRRSRARKTSFSRRGNSRWNNPSAPIVTVVWSTGVPSLRAFNKATCSRVSCAEAPRSR